MHLFYSETVIVNKDRLMSFKRKKQKKQVINTHCLNLGSKEINLSFRKVELVGQEGISRTGPHLGLFLKTSPKSVYKPR